MELEFLLFFEWCYVRYTNPQSGLARLVPFPEEEPNQLKALVASTRFVSTCSFHSLRERDTLKSAIGPSTEVAGKNSCAVGAPPSMKMGSADLPST